jgi:hypothetical protein
MRKEDAKAMAWQKHCNAIAKATEGQVPDDAIMYATLALLMNNIGDMRFYSYLCKKK